MSFFQASNKQEDVRQGGSDHITKSGIYPVELIAAIASVSSGGSTTVDVFVDHNGQKQVIYGNLRIKNNDGTKNKIGSKVFNQLVIITGNEAVSDPVDAELPIGKKGAMKGAAVLEDLSDNSVFMRIQMEYGAHNSNITEKKVIKAFFRADKATAEEIVQGVEPGAGFEREMKYADHITYKDGVTEEDVAEWITAKRPDGTAVNSGGGSQSAPGFGNGEKKRFGE